MLARLLIPLCLCCVVLCTFVGYVSKRAIEDEASVASESIELDCDSFVNSPPKISKSVVLRDFVFVDEIATIDSDGDGKWDEVAIPLFSPKGFTSKASYSAVIACFRDVPDLETLHQKLAANKLQTNYLVHDQTLASRIHSQLATSFKNMDFANSPVVTVGYGQANPLLGEKSLKYSYMVGAGAVGLAVLTLAYLILAGLLKQVPRSSREPRRKRTKKRGNSTRGNANQDAEPTGGVLDQVRSLREKQVQT